MTGSIERRPATPEESSRASRAWWDGAAAEYQQEHGAFLGDASFVWGPEGLDEASAGLLGPVEGRRVLEIGAGAAQCSRWLVRQGAVAVASDLSLGMLQAAGRIDARTGTPVPLVQADAVGLPFAAGSFDLACSSYGALPFVADAEAVHREVARVLRPGGRWAFSVTHPIRWALPDDPGQGGLTVRHSYFDRQPYVETDDDGAVSYVEHHRTIGDQVRALVRTGFTLLDLVEPEWPAGHATTWGGWSPLRGGLIPGTLIFVAELPHPRVR